MLEEYGRVVALDENVAMVETIRASSCQSCEAKSTCGQGAISKVIGQKSCVISALNSFSLQVGDEVVLGLEETTLLKSALLAYLLPLVLMIFGAAVLQGLYGENDLVSAFGGLTGFFLGFILVYFYNHHHKDDERFQPIILRAVREDTTPLSVQAKSRS